MAFLRRALLLFAAVWGVCGTAIAVSPRWILVTWFDQVPYPDYTYVRVCGIAGLSSAALALMISRRLDDAWWWSWAFVLESGLTALVTTLHAMVSVPAGSAAWFWWIFAVTNIVLVAGLVSGIARAGVEKPIV
ncbi:MAG: hypothetical protein E6G37_09040 [Actinobacteria bacterium]|nr:MAG: hypothetical protein E6G65_07190 [Actinomycetota bacterium]TMK92194.1 MAG: hypothetical protein E6G37_09040 [Actinomycetota bacterium]TMM25658.1 MAG: hypothetical protein E6F95_01345 [Actinomycetota bacterium]